MAEAIKCDRCGKFYTSDEKIFKIPSNTVGKFPGNIGYIQLFTTYDNILQTYDLCDECAKDLWSWLNNTGEFVLKESED